MNRKPPPPKKDARQVDEFERDVRRNLYLAGQALDARDFDGVLRLAEGVVRMCLKRLS